MSKSSQIRALLEERILAGNYPVGSRLPSLRELARELDAHPNTVAHAYRELSDAGTVRLEQGRGTFVVKLPAQPSTPSQKARLLEDVTRMTARARSLGIDRQELLDSFNEAVLAAYERNGVRISFVECNPYDTTELAEHIGNLLRVHVEPLLVQDLLANPAEHVPRTDMFITTPFHIDEVESALENKDHVISVNVTPSSTTLVELSRIPSTARVAAVATNARTLRNLVRMITIHARSEPAIQSLITASDLRNRLKHADVIIGTQAIQDSLAALSAGRRQLTVHYRLEANSAEFLVERMQDLDLIPQFSPAMA